MKGFFIFMLILLLPLSLTAVETYKGRINLTVKGVTGEKFYIAQKFKAVSLKPQKIYFFKSNGKEFERSKDSYVNIIVKENTDDKFSFSMDVNLIEIIKGTDEKNHFYKNFFVKGMLNSKNEYLFIENNEPDIKLDLNFDKIFSKDEIIKRFKKSELLEE